MTVIQLREIKYWIDQQDDFARNELMLAFMDRCWPVKSGAQ
jgi:hypothetical protein